MVLAGVVLVVVEEDGRVPRVFDFERADTLLHSHIAHTSLESSLRGSSGGPLLLCSTPDTR